MVGKQSSKDTEPSGPTTHCHKLQLQESSDDKRTPSPKEHVPAEVQARREADAALAAADLREAQAQMIEAWGSRSHLIMGSKPTSTGDSSGSVNPPSLKEALKVSGPDPPR